MFGHPSPVALIAPHICFVGEREPRANSLVMQGMPASGLQTHSMMLGE